MTFKVGDKVYCYNYGIVRLIMSSYTHFPLKVQTGNNEFTFTQCGRRYPDDKYPSIITLEEAEKRRFVRKKVGDVKQWRVKYYDKVTASYYIKHHLFYRSEEEFKFTYPEFQFISFVNERLDEFEPPEDTVDWEEV